MLTRLFARRSAPKAARPVAPGGPRFRPMIEGFEDRVVPAAPVSLAPALAAPAAATPASILPINITGVTLDTVTGALTAVGTIGNQAFSLVGQLTGGLQGTTPILHLRINAIHLDLLGLTVDTSDICLDITATAGPGNLLGNLLTGLAGGAPLSGVGGLLGGLTTGAVGQTTNQLGALTGELTDLLNGVFGALTAPSAVTGTTGNILHLSLGPVNLSLLGLNVGLDNCADGPVTIDVGAQTGPGKLLGNLLNSVTHLLDGPANTHALTNALNRVAGAIGNIVGHV